MLAVASYATLAALGDEARYLNLAWTLDERAYLSVDVAALIARELALEIEEGLPFLNSYFVRDPFGEEVLGEPVRRYFANDSLRITVGAGVDSLLHAMGPLAAGKRVYVAGDVYPDGPHWFERFGARCLSTHDAADSQIHLANARALDASVVLMDRPALLGKTVSLEQLGELCEGMHRVGARVIVDESYANYFPTSFSAVHLLPRMSNLLVLRGFSKAYWLGGLRLGYCVCAPALVDELRAWVPPLLGASVSLRIARAVLEAGDIARPLRERIAEAQKESRRVLQEFSLGSPLEACMSIPYLFFAADDRALQERLLAAGILGKLQPLWRQHARRCETVFRLSVPLKAERAAALRQRLT
ncbi:MAG: aminotransferase class I/II-fold pyridoxal phosphate-dependent enzyme [Gammaproteobacteria bacterium]